MAKRLTLCTCGHSAKYHASGTGECFYDTPLEDCLCKSYRDAADKVAPPVITSSACKWCGASAMRGSDECRDCQDVRFASPLVFKWVLKLLKLRG